MEAISTRKKVIVVPNTLLADNHQIELAECFSEKGYILMSDTK